MSRIIAFWAQVPQAAGPDAGQATSTARPRDCATARLNKTAKLTTYSPYYGYAYCSQVSSLLRLCLVGEPARVGPPAFACSKVTTWDFRPVLTCGDASFTAFFGFSVFLTTGLPRITFYEGNFDLVSQFLTTGLPRVYIECNTSGVHANVFVKGSSLKGVTPVPVQAQLNFGCTYAKFSSDSCLYDFCVCVPLNPHVL